MVSQYIHHVCVLIHTHGEFVFEEMLYFLETYEDSTAM